MAYLTYTALITECISRLRQVGGTSTQLYSEGVIGSYIQEAYDILREEAWWPWLMKRVTGTLDGTTGKVNSATLFSTAGITDYDDIRAIYYETSQTRLPKMGEDINPSGTFGNTMRYVEPLSVHDDPTSQYLFRIWPLNTTGTVAIWARVSPTGIFTNPAVVVPMDRWLIVNYVAWRYLTDDAANPGGAAAALQVFERLKTQAMSRINDEPIWYAPGVVDTNNGWQETA